MQKNKIPPFRQQVIENWAGFFSQSSTLYVFDVEVHGVELQFRVYDKALFGALQDFFPKVWQQEGIHPIVVEWCQPPEELQGKKKWDDIASPDCAFEGSFISQRDFLAKKISVKEFQLLAFTRIDDGFFNFLRYLLPIELFGQSKILFHSSCVVNEKSEAFLFFGHSGAGKTTISELCSSGEVLGDDMNILSIKDGQVYVEAATVGQRIYDKKNFGIRYPLHKAFWLQKDSQHHAELIATGGYQFLLSSFAGLFWDQLKPIEFHKVFSIANQLRSNLQLYKLFFSKDRGVWEYVQTFDKNIQQKHESPLAKL